MKKSVMPLKGSKHDKPSLFFSCMAFSKITYKCLFGRQAQRVFSKILK